MEAAFNQQCVMLFGISHLLEVVLLMDCAQNDADTVFHSILFLNLQNIQKNEEKKDLDLLSMIKNQFINKDMNQIKSVLLQETKAKITVIVLHQGIYTQITSDKFKINLSRQQESQSVDMLDRLFAAGKATAEAPIQATNLIRNSNSSSGGTQNLAKTLLWSSVKKLIVHRPFFVLSALSKHSYYHNK